MADAGGFIARQPGSSSGEADVWAIELELWLGGRAAFEAALDPECQMANPDPWDVLDRAGPAPEPTPALGWSDVTLRRQALARPRQGVAVLAYQAQARDGERAAYEAECTSTYVERDGVWRIVQHRERPLC